MNTGIFSSFFSRESSAHQSHQPPPSSSPHPSHPLPTSTSAQEQAEIERFQYEQAEYLLKAAVNADIRGHHAEAFEYYQQALNLWLEILNQTTDEIRRSQIAELVSVYMSKAEAVKMRLLTPTAQSFTRETPHLQPKKGMNHPTGGSGRGSGVSGRGGGAGTSGARTTGGSTTATSSQETKFEEHESVILSEMLDSSPGIRWSDIIGLEFAKRTIQEAVIYPYLRPDIFRGLRAPPKGVLLYGPPGTGKTMIAKAVATESGFKFFNISASTVMNKYLGEGEKLMKAVFSIARKYQPSVVFFDEIDSLLSARKEGEHEASRRIKTEFMIQLDGAASKADDKILIIGATNLPWELDEAALRRFVRRIYIPLPDPPAREALIRSLFLKQQQPLPPTSATLQMIQRIVHLTEGYSAADITALFQDAAMGPLREIPASRLPTIRLDEIRPITEQDFVRSTEHFKPSVSQHTLEAFQKWQSNSM